jgi:hypothetical protein
MRTTDPNKRIIPIREEFDLVELKLQEAVEEIEQKIMGITGEDSADVPPVAPITDICGAETLDINLATTSSQIIKITGESDNSTEPDISLSTTSSQIIKITGESDNSTEPDINLATTSSQIIKITGESDNSTEPDINLATTSSQIIKITGESTNSTEPDISLSTTSSQIIKITGESTNSTEPDINLADTKIHVDTSLATPGASVHGMVSFNDGIPMALGLASAGSSMSPSRSDHVHQKPTASYVGAISTSALSDTTPNVLTVSGNSGTSTNVSRSDHAHPFPTASNIGAISTSALSDTTPNANSVSGNSGTSTNVSRSDHTHPGGSTYNYSGPALTGSYVVSDIRATNGIITAIYSRSLTPGDIGAANVGGSASQTFAASTLTVDKITVDAGQLNGMRSGGGNAAIGFSTSVAAALSLANDGFYVKNLANTAWAPLEAGVITYDTGTGPRSDERLKRDIVHIALGDGLNQVCSLAAIGLIEFRMIEDSDSSPIKTGFSAQAVAKVMPCASRVLSVESNSQQFDPPLLGFDVVAVLARVVESVAILAKRLDVLEKTLLDQAN